MSLTATARSVGDTLRQEVLVDGRHRLTTDEPAQLGGTDTGPAPHELVPAALAACVAVTIRMYARTKGWTLGELSVDVVYDNTSTPRHFDVTVNLPRDLTPEQVRRLMRGHLVAGGLQHTIDSMGQFLRGRPALEALVARVGRSGDRDLRWIARENLRKRRLQRLDADWVATLLARLD